MAIKWSKETEYRPFIWDLHKRLKEIRDEMVKILQRSELNVDKIHKLKEFDFFDVSHTFNILSNDKEKYDKLKEEATDIIIELEKQKDNII